MGWGGASLPLYGRQRPAGVPVRRPGTSVAVGTQTRAYREQQAAQARPGGPLGPGSPAAVPSNAAAPTWTPPPLGTYNPSRDVEVEEGQRGLGQLEGEVGTARARDTSNYFLKREGIEGAQGRANQDYSNARAALQRSFAALAGQQAERANAYGVLGGGALVQSAAKRAVNQGLQQQAQDLAHSRQGEGFSRQLAELALEGAPPDASNPQGGRAFQDLLTKLTNAQANQAAYEVHQHTLASDEAAPNGYEPQEPAPAHGAPHAPARPSRARRPGGGAARLRRIAGRHGL